MKGKYSTITTLKGADPSKALSKTPRTLSSKPVHRMRQSRDSKENLSTGWSEGFDRAASFSSIRRTRILNGSFRPKRELTFSRLVWAFTAEFCLEFIWGD